MQGNCCLNIVHGEPETDAWAVDRRFTDHAIVSMPKLRHWRSIVMNTIHFPNSMG